MSKNSAYSCLAWLATITLISVTVYLGCLPSTSQNKWQFMAQHLCQPFCSSSLMLTFPHLQIYLCSERTSPEQRQIHEPHLDGMGYDKLKLLDAHPCDGCNHWLAQLSDRLFLLVTSVTPRWSLANKIARARLLFFCAQFWNDTLLISRVQLASPCPFCHNRASLWPLPIEFRARFHWVSAGPARWGALQRSHSAPTRGQSIGGPTNQSSFWGDVYRWWFLWWVWWF